MLVLFVSTVGHEGSFAIVHIVVLVFFSLSLLFRLRLCPFVYTYKVRAELLGQVIPRLTKSLCYGCVDMALLFGIRLRWFGI